MKHSSHRSKIRRLGASGFTIIELMIVLAIAALILLIVLLAIPALERNSRNNERKQDVQAILEAVSHYQLNNTGAIPTTSGFLQYTKLHIYDTADISTHVETVGTTSHLGDTNHDIKKVEIYNFRKCSTVSPGSSTNAGAGFGDVVALYAIETATAEAPQCQQL